MSDSVNPSCLYSKSLQYQSQLEPIKEDESITTSLANNKNEIENSDDDLDITNDDIHSDSKHSSEDYEILSASDLEVNN
ncbi:hypothetical protein GJ496_002873 [Pomphorhynchus laevis]|nr:hypothetical protein GJ496_002873 [Pomphorhynchus laevis]